MNIKEYALKNKIFIAILLIVTAIALVFCFKKEGYHVDEMYSYGLANSEYLPFMHFGESGYDVKDWMNDYGAGESIGQFVQNMIKDAKIVVKAGFKVKETEIYSKYLEAQKNSADTLTSSWVSGKEYEEYITADKHNKFNYASVYYNQRGDVHPPLYYIILHTICSLTEGHFSKWTGLGINIVCIMLALTCIYEMSKRYLGGIEAALSIVTLYGISSTIMSLTVYIRMYALFMLITMVCMLLHLRMIEKKYEISKNDYLRIGGIVLLGYLTHYYFVVYIIGLAAVFVITMLVRKKFKAAIKYCLTMFASGAVGIIVWPFSIRHVFSGYRGNQAFASMKSTYSFYKLGWMVETSVWVTLGKIGIAVLILAFIISIVTIVMQKKKYPFEKLNALTIPTIFSTIVVTQISPFYTEKYLMNILPFIIIIPVYILTLFVKAIQDKGEKENNNKLNIGLIISLASFSIIIAIFNNCFFHNVMNLYENGQETVVIEENTDCVCVLPYGDWNETAEDSMILAKCNKVGIVYENNIGVLKDGYKYKKGSKLLVNVAKDLDADETLEKVKEELGVTSLQEIKRSESAWCTRIWLAQ